MGIPKHLWCYSNLKQLSQNLWKIVSRKFCMLYLATAQYFWLVYSSKCCYSSGQWHLCLPTAHVSEVEAIAGRAERDVKVESAIKNFEEVWLSKLFDLTEYQRSYPTTRTEVCTIIWYHVWSSEMLQCTVVYIHRAALIPIFTNA